MFLAPDRFVFCLSRRRPGGFTLVELLVVIGLIGLLSALLLGALRGAKRQARVNQARAELAAIGEMLESYRREFGDYPPSVVSPCDLYAALARKVGPTGELIPGPNSPGGARIALHDPDHPDDPANRWVDPWGRDYEYVAYERARGALGVQRGFVLYSHGDRAPDEVSPTRQEVVPEVTGDRGGVISPNLRSTAILYVVR